MESPLFLVLILATIALKTGETELFLTYINFSFLVLIIPSSENEGLRQLIDPND